MSGPGRRFVTHSGKRRHIAEWARIGGLREDTLTARIARGWPFIRALMAPVRERGIKHCGWCGDRGHTVTRCSDRITYEGD